MTKTREITSDIATRGNNISSLGLKEDFDKMKREEQRRSRRVGNLATSLIDVSQVNQEMK